MFFLYSAVAVFISSFVYFVYFVLFWFFFFLVTYWNISQTFNQTLYLISNFDIFVKRYRWTRLGDIRIPRCQASLVAVGGDLYLCGGATRTHGTDFTTATSLRDIDKYSKEFDMWEKVAELDTERHACGAAAVGKIRTVYLVCWLNVLLVNWKKILIFFTKPWTIYRCWDALYIYDMKQK